MPQTIQCEHCGKQLRLPPTAVGKRVRCPACKEAFIARLPAPDESPADEDDEVQFEVVKKGEGIKSAPGKARPQRDEEETEDEEPAADNDTGFEVVDDEEEEEEEEKRPSRGIKERPSSKRARSEDEEDDRPSRRSSKARSRERDDYDDDEDDRPRKRRRPRRPQRSFVKSRPNYRAHNGVQLLLYSIGTLFLGMICCPILSILLNLYVLQQAKIELDDMGYGDTDPSGKPLVIISMVLAGLGIIFAVLNFCGGILLFAGGGGR